MNSKEIEKAFVKLELPVLWGDMDAAQHVNNTIYLKWVESARLAFFEKLQHGDVNFKTVGPILAWQDCKYIFPLTYPDTVVVTHDVIKLETDRIQCKSIVYSKTHHRLVAIAHTTLVAYNYKALKKASIPEEWIQVLRGYYGEDDFIET